MPLCIRVWTAHYGTYREFIMNTVKYHLKNHVMRNRADGVGFMTSADKFQLVYVEGSRPVTRDEKETLDAKKIGRNLKNMYSKIVTEITKNRRRLPKKLYIFGGQSIRLRLHLYYMDFCGTFFFFFLILWRNTCIDNFITDNNLGEFRLNEIDNTNLPSEFSEMRDFVYFYEFMLKWGVSVTARFCYQNPLTLHIDYESVIGSGGY